MKNFKKTVSPIPGHRKHKQLKLDPQPAFWSIPAAELLQQLQTTPQGLTNDEARERFIRYGANLLKPKKRSNTLTLLLSQFKSPIILILIFASGLSFFLHDPLDAGIILAIVLVSGLLGFILHASPEEFRAGWFLESVISASLVVLVVRTRMPFFKSIPGKYLLTATLLVISVTLVLPFISVGRKLFGFTALPISFLILMGVIVALYIISAEVVKKAFYKKVQF